VQSISAASVIAIPVLSRETNLRPTIDHDGAEPRAGKQRAQEIESSVPLLHSVGIESGTRPSSPCSSGTGASSSIE
jgi:hypothetical protein